MLFLLQQLLINKISFMRVFKYISVRAMLAFFLSYFIVLLVGRPFIKFLRRKKIGDDIREEGPQSHFSKKGTPTMGGVLIIGSILFTTLITGNLTNRYILSLIVVTLIFSAIGFIDDYIKFTKSKKGLSGKKKILGQLIASVVVYVILYTFKPLGSELTFSVVNPLLKNSYLYIGPILMFIFIAFVLVGSSNAVNVTDGLDGLVIVPVMIVAFVLLIVSYFTGNINWSRYLNLYYVSGTGEIMVYLSALIGAGLGFLWYNFYPAQIFMGDTGSLTLGGVLATISIFLKQELLFALVGIVFVVEALSVILQVWSFKKRGKRIFAMAPIHHHFELKGMPETKVTARFWIITIMFAILGILILKLR
ncbi:MAG: phospho-N-acetylmuramoyl-pentapeptide-transferase [Fusobacteriaceae bacterium]|nr:phospho-N-acetylmuramoyl-pentapeptide-transferase [Fusobacteriaceae bacterium]MBN2839234.1 phospho-N-acetylmuramoyl-pentapeptide-transferase [Fusobacteriaceae bacterium]